MWDKSHMKVRLPPDASPLAHGIYARMIAAGLTQKSLSLAAGLGATYVRDIFRGGPNVSPRIDGLEKLAKFFGCRVEDLSVLPDPNEPQRGGEFVHEPDEIRLIFLWRPLDVEVKKAIFTFANAVANAMRRRPDAA